MQVRKEKKRGDERGEIVWRWMIWFGMIYETNAITYN